MNPAGPDAGGNAWAKSVLLCFSHGRADELVALAELQPAGSALRASAQALAAYIRWIGGVEPWETVEPTLNEALSAPDLNADVSACLLYAAFRRALSVHNEAEYRRVLARMKRLLAQTVDPRARCLWFRGECLVARYARDQAHALSVALEACLPENAGGDEDLRLEFQSKAFECAVKMHDFTVCAELLPTLVREADRIERSCAIPARCLVGEYYIAVGDAYEAVRWLKHYTVATSLCVRVLRGGLYARALMHTGRLDDAEDRLQALRVAFERNPGEAEQSSPADRFDAAVQLYSAYAMLAIAHGEFDDARLFMKIAESANPTPQYAHTGVMKVLLHLDLCEKNRAGARALLAQWGAEGTASGMHPEWMRYHLLEGNEETAATHLACMLAWGRPQAIEASLRWCVEIAPDRLARLWSLATAPDAALKRLPGEARSGNAHTTRPAVLVGDSPAMGALRRLVASYARTSSPVLVTGETGTGKEIVARLLHNLGPKADQPFLALNCAAIPDSLAEAELFGHVEGAFTGAVAASPGLIKSAGAGTVFLDEINSVSKRLQALLLRLLDTGDYLPVGSTKTQHCDARFILASNVPLEEAIESGAFRADLYYRLNRFVIHVPPLRAHKSDIPALAGHFIGEFTGSADVRCGEALLARLMEHDWPGNVRELRNEVERLAFLHAGKKELPMDTVVLHPRGGRAGGAGDVSARLPRMATPDVGVIRGVGLAAETDAPLGELPGTRRSQQRYRRILAIFEETGRLYPHDVVRALGCSPTTATKDLRILERAGILKRIMTSAHVRTSYFVRNDVRP